MILIIDNYDSFTYNLVQCVGSLGYETIVYRNDQITIEAIKELKPEKIIISPGPGNPSEAGISIDIIKKFGSYIPILGVCLGHQSIGEAYGAQIIKADYLMHGKISSIYHNNRGIFKSLPNPMQATRYHSLVIDKKSCLDNLDITAWTSDDIIMGCQHKIYNRVYGVQFHPESILTKCGEQLIANFLKLNY
uniref:anthranilate synthase component 2 n=1 Tax=Erythrolobus coxiae TaxID=362235 RepID=UPI001FCD1BDC|nr:anthranilate synthase component 2 [Erythrolobus coxiae]UNJ17711.1 anthranilate synthase component 2 [Erythrolobus coxiae]